MKLSYTDIGAAWRDELEVPKLRQVCRRLYSEVRPLYTLLHGVVRYYLRRLYGDAVPENGPIPAHLLGNLWSQNWESLIDLITPNKIDLDESIAKLNWTVQHMVKRVEDFYQSMGLPAMTETFWRESVFENKNGVTRCHGTAADMFKDGDFRLLYCAGKTMKDFYVLHHEFGHIHYYMAYEDQPGIFRQANAALHESIGDSIMYGVTTPQHLNRLGLVNDTILFTNTTLVERGFKYTAHIMNHLHETENEKMHYTETNDDHKDNLNEELNLSNEMVKTNSDRIVDEDQNLSHNTKTSDNINDFANNNDNEELKENNDDIKAKNLEDTVELTTDEILLLKQALNKIPQIPFALVIDEYRWKYFEGGIDGRDLNKYFWDLSLELQGVAPPTKRGEEYFDVGAKFHVPDNTPFVRYFLSSFLQQQIFEALCRAAVFGRRDSTAHIPESISLHRCDIYGSKAAGKMLKDLMSRGHSQHWREILQSTIGNNDITAAALERYYRPLVKLLTRIVRQNNIPLGW